MLKRIVQKKSFEEFPELMTTSEAARLLNVHVNTIRRWSNSGKLKTYRLGPRADRRFDRKDLSNLSHRVKRSHN
ncbi:MAG: helix-turn-helix domain-containing protein [Dehalococcoidales bacterium]|nr:helix-turn-helix domain-containing protein [Dehalococcoidales bacterium]